jgi:hypothetical protein
VNSLTLLITEIFKVAWLKKIQMTAMEVQLWHLVCLISEGFKHIFNKCPIFSCFIFAKMFSTITLNASWTALPVFFSSAS